MSPTDPSGAKPRGRRRTAAKATDAPETPAAEQDESGAAEPDAGDSPAPPEPPEPDGAASELEPASEPEEPTLTVATLLALPAYLDQDTPPRAADLVGAFHDAGLSDDDTLTPSAARDLLEKHLTRTVTTEHADEQGDQQPDDVHDHEEQE